MADDASLDATPSLVEVSGDPRIRLLRLETNGGPGAARNSALQAATGRYIAILDADDEVRPDRMARLVSRLDDTGADAIVDNIEYVGGRHGAAPAAMFPRPVLDAMPALSLSQYVLGNRLFAGAYNFGYFKPVLRRTFLSSRAIRYSETIRIGEDYLFLASVLAEGGVCLVGGEIGYTYHVTDGSISRTLSLAEVQRMIESDVLFLKRYRLEGKDLTAQRARTRSLNEAASFLSMVDAIKSRSPGRMLSHALRAPAAVRHFRMPIAARFCRLTGRGS